MPLFSTKREVAFSGPRSSEEFNRWISEVTADLYHLYRMALEHNVALPRDYGLLLRENFFLQRKIQELSTALEALEGSVGSFEKKLRRGFFDASGLLFPPQARPVDVDTSFGIAHAHAFESVSKVYLTDAQGNPHLPQAVEIDVYESVQPILLPDFDGLEPLDDESLRRCIDGDLRTFWMRDSVQPTTVDEVYVAVHLRLPRVFSHLLGNAVIFRPVPIFSLSLLDVWIKGASEWKRISTYPLGAGDSPQELAVSGDRLLVFPDEDISEVICYFKQPFWFNKDGDRWFTYGLRELGVSLMRFAPSSTVIVPFEIPGDSLSFEEITSVTPVLAPGAPQDAGLVETRLLVGDEEYDLGEQLPALTRDIHIELTLKSHLNASPLIQAVEIGYTYA